MDQRSEWIAAREALMGGLASLGFPEEMAEPMAKQLGSPKAIRRMTSYLYQAKPRSMEEIVDEMLAICADFEAWRNKKASEEANSRYNEFLNRRRDDD